MTNDNNGWLSTLVFGGCLAHIAGLIVTLVGAAKQSRQWERVYCNAPQFYPNISTCANSLDPDIAFSPVALLSVCLCCMVGSLAPVGFERCRRYIPVLMLIWAYTTAIFLSVSYLAGYYRPLCETDVVCVLTRQSANVQRYSALSLLGAMIASIGLPFFGGAVGAGAWVTERDAAVSASRSEQLHLLQTVDIAEPSAAQQDSEATCCACCVRCIKSKVLQRVKSKVVAFVRSPVGCVLQALWATVNHVFVLSMFVTVCLNVNAFAQPYSVVWNTSPVFSLSLFHYDRLFHEAQAAFANDNQTVLAFARHQQLIQVMLCTNYSRDHPKLRALPGFFVSPNWVGWHARRCTMEALQENCSEAQFNCSLLSASPAPYGGMWAATLDVDWSTVPGTAIRSTTMKVGPTFAG